MGLEVTLLAVGCLLLGAASGAYLGRVRLARSLRRHLQEIDAGPRD